MFSAEPLQEVAFVHLAFFAEQFGFLVRDMRRRAFAARDFERKSREVLTVDVVVQIRRRKKDLGVYSLHEDHSLCLNGDCGYPVWLNGGRRPAIAKAGLTLDSTKANDNGALLREGSVLLFSLKADR